VSSSAQIPFAVVAEVNGDLGRLHLVHGGLRRLAELLADERDELVATMDDLAMRFGRVTDEVVSEYLTPGIPLFGVQQTAVLRLELFDRLNIVERGNVVRTGLHRRLGHPRRAR